MEYIFSCRKLKGNTSKRWFSILICGLIAAIIWLFIEPWSTKMLRPFAEQLATWPHLMGVVALFILLAAVFYPFSRNRYVGFFGLKHFWRYPPLWLAIVVAANVLVWVPSYDEWTPYLLVFNVGMLILTFIARVLHIASTSKRGEAHKTIDLQKVERFSELNKWLLNDDEITHPEQDRLDHNLVAKRIADRLKKSQQSSIAILGALGSGKSSIGRLVEHHLKGSPYTLYLQISLWPYNTTEVAVSGILNSLIDKLGQEINTLSLSGLADRYLYAIERTSGPFSGFIRLLKVEPTPTVLLKKLATVADACNLKVVLWIDDLERFTNNSSEENNPPNQRHENINSLQSLLYLLDQQACISVIVASPSLSIRFDQQKIARYIERVPKIDHEKIHRLTKVLRDECLNKQFIDPTPQEERDERFDTSQHAADTKDRIASSTELDAHQEKIMPLSAAFSTLCDSPRTLKSVLRLTFELWDNLAGEVNYEQLLFISLIKVVNPALFSLFDEHIKAFKNELEKHRLDDFWPPNDFGVSILRNELQQITGSKDKPSEIALNSIACFLFPAFMEPVLSLPKNSLKSTTQGVDKFNYWQRCTDGLEVEEEEKDQLILYGIEQWIEGVNPPLINFLISRKRLEKIIYLLKSKIVSPYQFRALFLAFTYFDSSSKASDEEVKTKLNELLQWKKGSHSSANMEPKPAMRTYDQWIELSNESSVDLLRLLTKADEKTGSMIFHEEYAVAMYGQAFDEELRRIISPMDFKPYNSHENGEKTKMFQCVKAAIDLEKVK